MNIFKKAVLYRQKQEQMMKSNAEEVERSNSRLTFAILIMGCAAFIPFLVVSFTVSSYNKLTAAYGVMFCVLILILLLFKKLRRHFSSALIAYVAYGLLVAYSIFTSAFVTPESISVIILFFLFQIPIVVIDKGLRVNLVVILYSAVYMIVAIPFKDSVLVADEILNCLLFAAFGIGLGEILRSARLQNLELKRQALIREKTDDLTGLYSRKNLFEHFGSYGMTEEKPACAGLLMIDVDYFKAYNDTYGHQAGDDCLRKIGDCFRAFGKEFDVKFFRYGGEEFVGVSTENNPEELYSIAETLVKAIYKLKIPHSAAKDDFITISAGVSSANDVSVERWEKYLLSQADIALYAAKTKGRNCAVQFEPGMSMADSSAGCYQA